MQDDLKTNSYQESEELTKDRWRVMEDRWG